MKLESNLRSVSKPDFVEKGMRSTMFRSGIPAALIIKASPTNSRQPSMQAASNVVCLFASGPLELAIHNGFGDARPSDEMAEDHWNPVRNKLELFLPSAFPSGTCRRLLLAGAAASRQRQ
jgi:hypothetical protein